MKLKLSDKNPGMFLQFGIAKTMTEVRIVMGMTRFAAAYRSLIKFWSRRAEEIQNKLKQLSMSDCIFSLLSRDIVNTSTLSGCRLGTPFNYY